MQNKVKKVTILAHPRCHKFGVKVLEMFGVTVGKQKG